MQTMIPLLDLTALISEVRVPDNYNHPLLTALLRYLKGVSLYHEVDHLQLTTDPTIYTPSSDGRLFEFLHYQVGITPVFRDDAIIIGPCLHPSQAMVSLCLRYPTRLCALRSVLRQSWHKSIGR